MNDTWPTIDPAGLSRSQQAGQRCAVPNCRRRGPHVQIGVFPDGRPALVCSDCAAAATPRRVA